MTDPSVAATAASASDPVLVARCPVGCDAPLADTALVLPEGALRRCPACGQWASAVTASRFEASMQEFDSSAGTMPQGRAAQRWQELTARRLDRLARALGVERTAMQVLDVGCSSGSFMVAATALGVRITGVEPAPAAAAAARARGLDVRTGTAADADLPRDAFDAAVLIEVIEHVPDAVALLASIRDRLRPGGVLLVGTANTASWTAAALGARWDYLSLAAHGGHISFFHPGSIALAARRAGFEVLDVRTRNVRLAERGDTGYRPRKLLAEALAWPARWAGRGHDLEALLRRPA